MEPDPRRYHALAPRLPDGPLVLSDIAPGDASLPVEVEIGFGRGLFLIERAYAAPETRLLGIEIKRKLAYHVAERLQRDGLAGRAAAYSGDAREILKRSGPDGSISRFHFNFPDPWWKKKHAKRRVLSASLLEDVARLLRPGGEVFVQTDVEDRAQDVVSELRAVGRFELLGDASGFIEANPFGARSNRERRAVEDGLPVFRVLARRV